ncbi:Uma2 family endonuclease [Phormidesmis sp. 146-35]
MSQAVALYRWTTDRYHLAVEAGIFDDQPVELLNGEIVEMAPEGKPHVFFLDRFANQLRRLLGDRAQVREGHPVTLPNHSEPEPDIAIVRPLNEVYLEHHPYPEDIFWLIEYSDSSLKKDLEVKSKVYASATILEYWVVNLQKMELVVFRDPMDGEYRSQLTLTSGTIAPLAFSEIQIEIGRLMHV